MDLSVVPHFVCPMTHCPFINPVVAADGLTYEKEAITDWLYRWAGGQHWAGRARDGAACSAGPPPPPTTSQPWPRRAAPRCAVVLLPLHPLSIIYLPTVRSPARRRNMEVSPVTGQLLPHRLLLPNSALRAAMGEVAELVRALLA